MANILANDGLAQSGIDLLEKEGFEVKIQGLPKSNWQIISTKTKLKHFWCVALQRLTKS